MSEDARDDDVTGLSDDAREAEVPGPEQAPEDRSLANRLIGSPGAGPESADPPEHAFEDEEDADR